MEVRVGKDDSEWTDKVWTWFHQELTYKDRVFMPAGQTAIPFYQKASHEPSGLLQSLKFLQLDEIVTGPQAGAFQKFFRAHMSPYVSQFQWIKEGAKPKADAAVLGVGLNGHVAFHEPGLPRDFYSGRVELSEVTKKALNLNEPTWAVTYGAAAFLACPKILVLARGEKKRDVLLRARTDDSLPIGWILQHPRVTLITDFNF